MIDVNASTAVDTRCIKIYSDEVNDVTVDRSLIARVNVSVAASVVMAVALTHVVVNKKCTAAPHIEDVEVVIDKAVEPSVSVSKNSENDCESMMISVCDEKRIPSAVLTE